MAIDRRRHRRAGSERLLRRHLRSSPPRRLDELSCRTPSLTPSPGASDLVAIDLVEPVRFSGGGPGVIGPRAALPDGRRHACGLRRYRPRGRLRRARRRFLIDKAYRFFWINLVRICKKPRQARRCPRNDDASGPDGETPNRLVMELSAMAKIVCGALRRPGRRLPEILSARRPSEAGALSRRPDAAHAEGDRLPAGRAARQRLRRTRPARSSSKSQGHTLVVTSDKDGADSGFDRELADAEIVISQPFWPAYLTAERIAKAPKLKLAHHRRHRLGPRRPAGRDGSRHHRRGGHLLQQRSASPSMW